MRETTLQADRQAFESYVDRMLTAYLEHTGAGGSVWAHHTAALQRRNAGRDTRDAFAGPWHTVRPYVTQEFRQWIDEYWTPRLTFAEFTALRREERQAERDREREWLDSAAYRLDQLVQWRDFNRDAAIIEARERGATFAELQAATGMARSSLAAIIAKLQPRELTPAANYYAESEPF